MQFYSYDTGWCLWNIVPSRIDTWKFVETNFVQYSVFSRHGKRIIICCNACVYVKKSLEIYYLTWWMIRAWKRMWKLLKIMNSKKKRKKEFKFDRKISISISQIPYSKFIFRVRNLRNWNGKSLLEKTWIRIKILNFDLNLYIWKIRNMDLIEFLID